MGRRGDFHCSRFVCQGSRPVFMVFKVTKVCFIVFLGSKLVFQGYRLVFIFPGVVSCFFMVLGQFSWFS